MFDEDLEVKQVEKDGGRADENVWEIRRVDLTEIAWEEAILPSDTVNKRCHARRAHGLRRTLAISSLFLSSPSTVMTFPFSSTSVHLNLGSKAAFAVSDLRLKIDPDSSSRRTKRSPSLSGSLSFFWSGPKIHSCQVNLLQSSLGGCREEAYRRPPAARVSEALLEVAPGTVLGCLAFSAARGRIASRPKTAAWREGSRRRVNIKEGFVVIVVIGLVVIFAAQVVQAWRRVDKRAAGGCVDVDRREAHSAKPKPSDWERRNRSNLRDGTAGFNAGGIVGAWTRVLEGLGHSGASKA